MNTLFQEANIGQLDFAHPRIMLQTRLILESYQTCFERSLINCSADTPLAEQARLLFLAPQAVLSHDREWRDDGFINIYNYANRASCVLFERSFEQFIQVPSMQSAAPLNSAQQGRNTLLSRCVLFGPQAYSGERKTANGNTIDIREAVLFNLVDERGIYRGQAAVIEKCSRRD